MVVEPGVDELEARSYGVEGSRGFTKFDRDRVQLDVVEERRAFTGGSPHYDDGRKSSLEARFQQTQHLLASVITDVASVTAFLGRWKVIENRLLQLPPLLNEISQRRRLSNNARVCRELLKGLVETLEGTRSLAVKCTDASYGGKLQTQSNLDSVCGRLDFHVHDCQLVIAGGGLVADEDPLEVVCRVVTRGSGREAMEWAIRELLGHVRIGSERALDAMLRVMEDDDENVVTVASQGGVTTLVRLLDASQVAVRERSAAAVCLLALNDSCERAVVAEGGVAPLVRVLGSGSARAQERAAAGLQGLSVSEATARAIACHGGVPALVAACRAGTPAAQAAAAGALRNLAAVETLRKGVADLAIPVIINLVDSGSTAMARENAAATLQNLAVADDAIRRRVLECGAAQPLIRNLDYCTQQEIALGALRNLAACQENVELLCSVGLLPRLAACLRAPPVAVQLVAANAICHVARCTEARRPLGYAGVIGPLVRLLDAKSQALQESCAQALALLLVVEENQKLFLVEEWGVVGLVQQLDIHFHVEVVGKRFPVAALQALAGISKCRKQMVTAGACFHLRRLAEKAVPGARRLLERLEGGKLRSIISKTLMINSFTN